MLKGTLVPAVDASKDAATVGQPMIPANLGGGHVAQITLIDWNSLCV